VNDGVCQIPVAMATVVTGLCVFCEVQPGIEERVTCWAYDRT